MEKLIELLNEYEDYKEKETEIRNYTRRNVKCDGIERIECLREVDGELFGEDECTAIIICKGYMFIQWLVENEKIDTEFEDNKMLGDIFDSGYRFNDDYMEGRLLCYLALSNTPIEFLISILK